MAYNVPAFNTDNYSFGGGLLYVADYGSWPGATPITEVGAVRSGAELAITREKLEVFQGAPRVLTKQYVTSESVQLTVTGIEWDLQNLGYALAQDSANVSANTVQFGGSMNLRDVTVCFEHRMPAGDFISIKIWKAQGTGEVSVTFGDDIHEIPYTFNALDPSSTAGTYQDWWGTTLPETGSLVSIGRAATSFLTGAGQW